MIPARSIGIARLFGGLEVVAYEAIGEADPSDLLEAERVAIEMASAGRRSQFAAGRLCARAALRTLAFGDEPLLIRTDRRPAWPEGAEGSISHTVGFGVAAVARTETLGGRGIGIDVEKTGRVHPKLFPKLFTSREIDLLGELSPSERALRATMVFGAKEAFYKAQFHRSRAWVGFGDIEFSWDSAVDWDSAVEMVAVPATELDVLGLFAWPVVARHATRDGVVISAVVAEPAQPATMTASVASAPA